MKRLFISAVLGLLILLAMSSCFHHHNISISISDDEDEYEMDASYRKDQAKAVQIYLDEHLPAKRIISIKNESENRELTLEDNTRIYVKSYPGKLKIKIDKSLNSEESLEKVKEICEDLKDILADN